MQSRTKGRYASRGAGASFQKWEATGVPGNVSPKEEKVRGAKGVPANTVSVKSAPPTFSLIAAQTVSNRRPPALCPESVWYDAISVAIRRSDCVGLIAAVLLAQTPRTFNIPQDRF